jgi:hypothetical protein
MKKLTVVFIEIGMLLGIVVAAFTVPRTAPFLTFLACSVAIFVAGNLFLVWAAKRSHGKEGSHNGEFWRLAPSVFLRLAVIWILLSLLTMIIHHC